MPVLIEDLVLLVRRETLAQKWPGGSAGFLSRFHDHARLDDGRLLSLSVPSEAALPKLLEVLARGGLVTQRGRELVDVAVASQRWGPFAWCRWLELAQVQLGAVPRVLAARDEADPRTEVTLPAGWSWETSRSRTQGAARLSLEDRPLRHLRREAGSAVYYDRFSGEQVRLPHPEPRVQLSVQGLSGKPHALEAEVVSPGSLSALGLMHRERLAPEAGMLFRLGPRPTMASFWMKNTRLPLDLLFLDHEGRVVDVAHEARPMTLDPVRSRRPCQQVLEVNAGWTAARAIDVGATVQTVATLSD